MKKWFQFIDAWLRDASAVRIAGLGAFIAFAAWVVFAIGLSWLGEGTGSGQPTPGAAPYVVAYEDSAPATPVEPIRIEGPGKPGGQVELPETSMATDLQRTLRDSRMRGLVGRLDVALPHLERWEAEALKWESERTDLLEGDLGRPLALDSENLPYLVELIRQANQLAPLFDSLREQFDAVVAMIDGHAGSGERGVSTPSQDAVTEICNEITSTGTKFEGVMLAIRKLVDSASSSSDETALTLQEAITEFHAEEARQAAEATVLAKLQAKKEMADRLLAAERDVAESETRLRMAQLNSEAERIKGEEEVVRAEAARKKEEDHARLQQEQLEAEFARDQSEIQNLLSPFVSLAKHKLYPPNNHLYTGQSTGVSLSSIAKFGALESTGEGIDAMSQLGQSPYRPLGSFPKYVQSEWKRSPEVRRRLERAQELLLKYGELLVEKGMLEK